MKTLWLCVIACALQACVSVPPAKPTPEVKTLPAVKKERCLHVYAVDAAGVRLPLDADGTYHVHSAEKLQFKTEWIACNSTSPF